MPSVHEQLSARFYEWEHRGRGWQVFNEPVLPEPPFSPFEGHSLPDEPVIDDGRRPSFLSSLVHGLSRKLSTAPPLPRVNQPVEEPPEPEPFSRGSIVELKTVLPAKLDISRDVFEHFLLSLSLCRDPIAFELLGLPHSASAQFAASPNDAPVIHRQLLAYFPEAVFNVSETNGLEAAWYASEAEDALVIEFGLKHEFMLMLQSGKLDPFVGIIGALSELETNEIGLFQVLFQSAHNEWADSINRAVTHPSGSSCFVNAPEIAAGAKGKIARPLFAAVVRIAVLSGSYSRSLQIACDLAGSLRVFANPLGNELIPLTNEHYAFNAHIEDVIARQSRRSGMLLNCDEFIGFVHLPSSAVRSPKLERDSGKTKSAPSIVLGLEGVLIGDNTHAGKTVPVYLTSDQRVRHTHIIGSSGSGKSSLLFNLIRQDIEKGQGVAVLDPHGDLIDQILGIIPANRVNDVVLVDPSDVDFPIGFNILQAHSEEEKNLLASDLVSVFQRLSTSWGDQMNTVLQNAILVFLESPRGGTLADLRRFLLEAPYRAEYLQTVTDPELIYYWQKVFPLLTGGKSIGPVLTRLQDFFSRKPLRNMVSQQENKIDFARIMDSGQIFLAKLSQGLCGAENSYLLGTLLISKFQQLAMARQSQEAAQRRQFWCYIDEVDHFLTPSMAEILKGARKYRLGLTLAHQELHQLQSDPKVASAVATHPCTRIVFRVSDDDAKKLCEGFESFDAKSLKTLEKFHAIVRVERNDFDFNLALRKPELPDRNQAEARRAQVIAASRAKYGTPRSEVEAVIAARMRPDANKTEPPDSGPSGEAPSPRPSPPKPPKPAPVAEKPNPVITPPPAPPTEPPRPPEVKTATSETSTPFENKTSGLILPTKETESVPSEVARPFAEPKDLGRGGAERLAIQERLQKEAHRLGFSAEIEKQLRKGSNQAADLVIRQGDIAIAVEITVTTTTDHEFGNVRKCLETGFGRVAVISTSRKRLDAISAAVQGGLGPEAARKVTCQTPDEFISELEKMSAQIQATATPAVTPGERKSHGRTVRRHLPKLSPEEQRERDAVVNAMLVQAMQSKK
jgi:hypothetical protein